MKCRAGWSTSWNQDCWEKYQYLQIHRWHHPYGRKRRTKEPLDESERGEWKFGLKLNTQKTNIMASGHITSWEIHGETVETWETLFSWAPKSLQMVTAAMKLKAGCSLEGKLWPTSVQFSRSVVSDSLRPHGLQHSGPPCPSPTPGVYSDSCPLSRWCHPTISSSVIPFSSRLQSFPASVSYSNESALRIRWPNYWSFSFNISPSNEHSGLISFRMDWLDLLAVQETLKSLLRHHSST